jgi:hypothetical protein
MATSKKAPVSSRALIQRLNRHLAKEGRKLRACRADTSGYGELGDWYETEGRTVTAKHVDPEAWARETGVLKPYEYVES